MTQTDSESQSLPELGEPLDERGLRILADVAGYLAAGMGSEEVFTRVAGVLARGLGADHCRIWMRAADGIWAMGDVTAKAMCTHVALYQGATVVADIVGEEPPPTEYAAVPRVTFTDPEVGAVGMSESEARAAGIDVAVVVKQVPSTFRGWLHGPGNEGVIKLIADREAGVLVGATAAGPRGGEVLGMLSTAVHARVQLSDLRHMIYAFPTFHGAIGEALGAYGRGTGKVIDPEASEALWR